MPEPEAPKEAHKLEQPSKPVEAKPIEEHPKPPESPPTPLEPSDSQCNKMLPERENGNKAQKVHNDQIRRWVTYTSTFVAVIAAFAAVIAAFAAIWSAYEARQTRVEDERPFIAVDATPEIPAAMTFHSSERLSPGEFLPLQTVVTAFGKTPSERIHIRCAVVAANQDVKWMPNEKYGDWHFVYLLPSRSGEIGCPFTGAPSTRPKSMDVTYIQFGVADYEDESGGTFHTPFCHMIIPGFPVFHVEQCNENFGLPKLE